MKGRIVLLRLDKPSLAVEPRGEISKVVLCSALLACPCCSASLGCLFSFLMAAVPFPPGLCREDICGVGPAGSVPIR